MIGLRRNVLAFFVSFFLLSTPSFAFEVFKTQAGYEYWWAVTDFPLVFTTNLSTAPPGAFESIENVFATWQQASRTRLSFSHQREDANLVFQKDKVDRRNLLIWYDDYWDPEWPRAAAFTWTWAYDNGHIADVDIVFNGKDYRWSTSEVIECPSGVSLWDLQSVATHEIGHLLGLAHPGDLFCFGQLFRPTMCPCTTKCDNGSRALKLGIPFRMPLEA